MGYAGHGLDAGQFVDDRSQRAWQWPGEQRGGLSVNPSVVVFGIVVDGDVWAGSVRDDVLRLQVSAQYLEQALYVAVARDHVPYPDNSLGWHGFEHHLVLRHSAFQFDLPQAGLYPRQAGLLGLDLPL